MRRLAGSRVLARLGWVLFALWGITVAPLAILHLALGSASGGGLLVPRDQADRIRRLYGWNLPLVLNLHVRDRADRVRSLLRNLERGRLSCPAFRRRSARLGTAVLPEYGEYVSALDRPEWARACVADALREILTQRGWPSGQVGDPAIWWQVHRAAFSPASIERLVARFLERGDPGDRSSLRRIGERAVPTLIRRLSGSSGSRLERATLVLADITGHRVVYVSTRGGRRRVLDDWRRYWRAEELRFRDLGRLERLWAAVARTRYGWWLADLLRGSLGMSSYYQRPVAEVLSDRLPVSVGLGLAAILLAYGLGVPLGVWLATSRRRRVVLAVDRALLLLYATPSYLLALFLLFALAGIWGPRIFPAGGLHSIRPEQVPGSSDLLDLLWHATLPVVSLALVPLALVARYQRAALQGELERPYVLALRARGASERRIVWRHALRSGILPVVGLLGIRAPLLVSGAVVTETVFDVPGLGQATMAALWHGDTVLFMGVTVLVGTLTLATMAASDVATSALDPRVRRPAREGA